MGFNFTKDIKIFCKIYFLPSLGKEGYPSGRQGWQLIDGMGLEIDFTEYSYFPQLVLSILYFKNYLTLSYELYEKFTVLIIVVFSPEFKHE